MAYSDSISDNAQLIKRTLTHVTDFSGRSRRTEVIYYWIASALVGVALNFIAMTALSFKASVLFGDMLELVLLVPMFALFVRRIHDQNRSGWLGLLLPLTVLLRIPQMVDEFRGDIQAMIAEKITPLGILASAVALAILVLCLLPGSDGPNPYGPDPRIDEV